MYKVGVIGSEGVVGKGITKLLGDYVVAKYDISGVGSMEDFKDLDLVVMCVPTPSAPNGSCDAKIVKKMSLALHQIDSKVPLLIKSTTPPSELLHIRDKIHKNIIFSPEFMGESKYFTPPWNYPDPEDMRGHTWQVFGGDKKLTSLCVDIFKRKMGVDTRFHQTDIVTASLAKYIENSFFAAKVTFANEWYSIAEAYGVDWNELRELWLLDPRVNRNHTLVFPKDRGYGGKCFPKDVKAIIYDSIEQGHKPELMMSVDAVNKKWRKE